MDVVIVGEVEVRSVVLSLLVVDSVVVAWDVDCRSVELVDEVMDDDKEVPVVAAAVVSESCLRSTAARPKTPCAQEIASSAAANAPLKCMIAEEEVLLVKRGPQTEGNRIQSDTRSSHQSRRSVVSSSTDDRFESPCVRSDS